MKSFVLLVLSLITEPSGARSSTVRGFKGGWLEFTSNYPNRNQKYDMVKVDKVMFRSFNTWENIGNLLLYHDTENKTVTVGIRPRLQLSTKHKIRFYPEKRSKKHADDDDDDDDNNKRKVEVRIVSGSVATQRVKTAAGATVTCDRPTQQGEAGSELFFCKENSATCEEILSTRSSEKRKGPFALEESKSSFSIFISHASSRDNGVYWCAEKTQLSRAGFQEIVIEVEDERSSTAASTRPTSASPLSRGVAQPPVLLIVGVCGAALVLTVVLIYKWKSRSGLKKKENKKENNPEETPYEEIQERPHTTESTTAIRSIYVTAGFPSNPPTEGAVGGAC